MFCCPPPCHCGLHYTSSSNASHAPLTVKAARPTLTHLGAIRDHVQRHHVCNKIVRLEVLSDRVLLVLPAVVMNITCARKRVLSRAGQ